MVVEIAKQLGTKVEINRERFDDFVFNPVTNASELVVFNYFIDDMPYELGTPVVLVGPLGMQAWRAQ